MNLEDTVYANNTEYIQKPSNYDKGVILYDSLYCEHWNWLWNYSTSRLKEMEIDIYALQQYDFSIDVSSIATTSQIGRILLSDDDLFTQNTDGSLYFPTFAQYSIDYETYLSLYESYSESFSQYSESYQAYTDSYNDYFESFSQYSDSLQTYTDYYETLTETYNTLTETDTDLTDRLTYVEENLYGNFSYITI